MTMNKEYWSSDEFDDDNNDLLSSCLVDASVLAEAKNRKKTENPSTKCNPAWIMPSFDDCMGSEMLKTSKSCAKAVLHKDDSSGNKPVKRLRGKTKAVSIKPKESTSTDLWVDKHKPHTQVDLAVHKKKVAELQDYLQLNFHKKHKKGSILLLTGPSGAGKTATVRVLAEEMHVEIQEWINPITDLYRDDTSWHETMNDFSAVGGQRYESQASLFRDFILRANRYPSLQMFNQHQGHHRLILVEDFPNIFFKNTDLFHTLLRDYHSSGQCPLVFILSDSAGGDSNERLLFPKDLQAELAITNICFNPIAPTSLTKILTRIVSAESSMSGGTIKVPPKSLIDSLATASSGDIRGAINALQFACLKDTRDLDDLISSQSQTALKKRPRGSSKTGSKSTSLPKKKAVSSKTSLDSDIGLAAIGGRDTSLFLFRALGKILYCKRGDPASSDSGQLPEHLRQHCREPLTFNPEDVIERSQLSADFFMAYLHQNYLDFYSELEDVMMAADYFCEADKLTTDWANRTVLRNYAASVAVRGVMFSNSARVSSTSLGWKPLHKPQVFEVKRKMHKNKETARYLFREQSWSPQELHASVIPYLKLINPSLKGIGQVSFIQEMSKFDGKNIKRLKNERLDEKDIALEDNEEDDEVNVQQTVSKPKDDYVGPVDDEVVIEDYDD